MSFTRFALVTALTFTATLATAHEFWLDPEKYQVDIGAPVIANLRNGQEFEGISLAYFPNRFTRFDIAIGDLMGPVPGRLGDQPALRMGLPGEGLAIAVYEATPSIVTYTEWDKFVDFAAHKDFPDAVADHEAAGYSKEKFTERYTRHVKTLVAVGAGAGQDRAFGLETEFVALTNPYTPGFDGQMRVALTYEGAPRADAQIEVFDRAPDDSVTITTTRTDARGEATIAVAPGHDYLFDAVVLRPAPDAGAAAEGPVWETLWAALTFAVPSSR
ncbi:DUF4198 domain-containing protein [Sulfitobacter sabulilitoris]|uniref:DUF4198 domain-containing protein n=1 Tax=Sulfitobacter sabulilitoris TaxID=2562655 RepID=A0A5S3PPS2_9RHOB|nr:DUF4198 domain-containing protein [Sulfitobacter sabulilitoris]TMM55590.1 DUF4198 domain-containing protein [Sulfitobacter sabulilitoris]